MSSKNQEVIRETIVKNRPDYATLFGAVELCECEHCRSVYSPAAYLVDLLQFLDPKIPGNSSVVTPLDVLIGNDDKKWPDGSKIIGRRPDLAHIQLSCENTNTTLPYVDLVNEVLESYITFGQTLPLKTDAAGEPLAPAVPLPNESSSGVTAAELAANPENIHDAAYEELEAAVYPFTLPFNQPITALRLTLEQMGTSRHEVMDVFGIDHNGDSDGAKAAGRALDAEALKLTEREFSILTGERFDGTAPVWPELDWTVSNFFGLGPPVDTPWISGSLPEGAVQHVDNDAWLFAAAASPPASGAIAHTSAVAPGLHQHFFDGVVKPEAKLKAGSDELLYAEIFLDPAHLPTQVMLQWYDGTWSHRAYWGESKITWGEEGTPSRQYMGPIPATGEWVRLEVPAKLVGLVDIQISGMAFTLFDGGATWGAAGKRLPSSAERLAHVPNMLARAGISYVELIALLRTHYINPALPKGEPLALFERIPFGFTRLSELIKSNFPETDLEMVKALDGAKISIDELRDWAAAHMEGLAKMIVLDAPDSSCDLTRTRVQHLDGTLLDDAELSRLHRFIRLWRKLGWSIADTDRAMIALQAADITPTFLRRLGQIVQLQSMLKLTPQQLFSFWGVVPTEGKDALYDKLFLNKALRDIDPAFEPVEGEYLRPADNLTIKDHIPALLAGLRTRADDLALIRAHAQWTVPGSPPTLATLAIDEAPLTVATATVLYRYVTLARALKLPVKDLILLKVLSGMNPFSNLSDTNLGFDDLDIDPARTLGFVRLADRVEQSGFTPATLSYLCNNLTSAPLNFAPTDESIQLLLAAMREGLVRITREHIPADDPTGELTRAKLSLFFEAHVVEQIMGLVAGTGTYTAPLAAVPAGVTFPAGKVTYDDKASHRLTATGWLTDTEKTALLALSNTEAYQKAVNSLYDQPRELLNETLVKGLLWTKAETDLKTSVLEAPSIGDDGKVDPALVARKFNTFLAVSLPYFRIALSRAFVKQTLAEALTLEPAAAALLLEGSTEIIPLHADEAKGFPSIGDFLALVGDGLTGTYEDINGTKSHHDPTINFQWKDKHRFSVEWQGKLLADKTQRYHFHVRAGGGVKFSVDSELLINSWKDTPPTEYLASKDLKAGKFYEIKLEYFNHDVPNALVELRWSGAGAPAEIVPSYRLYSAERGDVDAAARRTYIRLHKASILVNGFALTPREIAYLAQPTKTDGGAAHASAFDLNELPSESAPPDQRGLFMAWMRWNDFAKLRALLLRDPTSLLDVFTASSVSVAQTALLQATGWNASTLAALAGTLDNPRGFDLKHVDYHDPGKLLRLANAMRLLGLLMAPAAEVFNWATPAPTMQQARVTAQEAKRAHKAQYDNEAWLEIARPITDRLRESQRAALVDYLLPRLGYADAGQLFEHFLIDVQMSPCMQTSRIKQAISSVQLFVQYCRMNLVPNVSPKMIDSERWKWMQNYRIWEANLKVFLYPENWIEPELRDDKSAFFRELESELLQAEVTNETAEAAISRYLEKVDTVSQLQICGMYEQVAPDERKESVLHVFGRTFATPRVFYYRQRVTVNANYRYWTAWEKVPLDIEADEVLPVSWNRRLYLFWKVKANQVNNDTKTTFSVVQLAWSEYRQGKWSRKQVTPFESAVAIADPTVRMNVERKGDELTIVFATPAAGIGSSGPRFDKDFNLIAEAGQYEAISHKHGSLTFLNYNGLVRPSASLTKKTYHTGFLPASKEALHNLQFSPVAHPYDSIPVFARSPNMIDLYSPSTRPYTLNDYFFIQEGSRTYLVKPSSSVPPDVGQLLAEIRPYFPEIHATGLSLDKEESGVALQASLARLSTKANSWLSGKASIGAKEIQASSASFLADKTTVSKDISLGSHIFNQGVIKPGILGVGRYPAEFRFETFFHPYTAEFQRRLNRYGVPGLLNIDSQRPDQLPKVKSFADAFAPDQRTVKLPWPVHDVDFSFTGAYSQYNWELFFHIPLLLATRLSQNQRFEEAMRWFHFIFDPTAGSSGDPVPQRYWKVLPFRAAQPQRLDEMLKALHAGDQNAIAQWEDLQAHPFQPHRVARLRPIAYQKMVVMKYIDNLIAWGDQLFRRDTIEAINQATQLYVLAVTLLGPRAQRVPPRGRSTPKTYAQLRLGLDKFNQAMESFENDLPFSSRATSGESPTETAGLLGVGRSFYFCLPKNDKLLGYWDTVADRLFKIRHCMNIEGVVRELPLFEPSIDPGLLVRAAAAGIDLNSVLNDLSAPLPYYRFNTLLGKALELTGELRSLGSGLLAALEKRDAEHLANLRVSHETELLSLVKQVKQQQLTEAKTAEAALQKSRDVTQARFDFYSNVPQRIAEETNHLNQLKEAQRHQVRAQEIDAIGADVAQWVPDVSAGVSGPPTSVSAGTTFGRGNIIPFYQNLSGQRHKQAAEHTYEANLSSILGGWTRRTDDWKLQKDLAAKELIQIDKQITAASIRAAIAQRELDNTARQIEQSQEVGEFLRTKFSGEELYSWMVGDISTLYFQCYQMTYDLAKQAERSCRYDLGLITSSFIQFGAWDSLRKGLLCGERLYLQLKQMERAYLNGNRREYELTKHYSLLLNDPLELIKLKEQGWCEIDLPETLFDIDFPGHYMRRIKSVSITIPAVVGPYTGVNCTLTLLRDKTRVKSTPAEDYAERDGEEDDRFVTNWARMQAIATSSGQNDSGLFELNFRDERYLPFEGAGVMSRWRIELPRVLRQFDYDTISDVVLHTKYTARDGGVPLRDAAVANLKQQLEEAEGNPQTRLFSLRHEFPSEWHKLQTVADNDGNHRQAFSLIKSRFPFIFQGGTITVNRIEIFGIPKDRTKDSPAPELNVTLTGPPNEPPLQQFEKAASLGLLIHRESKNATVEVKNLGDTTKEADWTITVLKADVPTTLEQLEDILLLFHYSVEMPEKP